MKRNSNSGGKRTILLIALALLLYTLSAHAQTFSTTITLTPSSGTGINIDLISPDSYSYKSDSSINFRFVATYNKSLAITCGVYIDNILLNNITVTNGQETIMPVTNQISEGIHNWHALCVDSINNSKQSSSKSFVVDLTPPKITLINPDPALTLTSTMAFNFTPIDNIAGTTICSLMLNGETKSSNIQAGNNSLQSVTLTNLANGTYSWNVSCTDIAGNTNTSKTQLLYVDTNKNFSIAPNKNTYTLGEGGLLIITAPYNSEVKLLITTPKLTSIVKTYTGTYPLIDTIDYASYPGKYTIDGYLNYNGAVKNIQTSFDVTNTLKARIIMDKSKAKKADAVLFTGDASGGIGDITYSWEFGDGASTSGKQVSHPYTSNGIFAIKMTASDSKGNAILLEETIYVEDTYTATIRVNDKLTGNLIEKARVYLDGVEKKTDASGKAAYEMFTGTYKLNIFSDLYEPYINNSYDIFDSKETIIYLEPFASENPERDTSKENSNSQEDETASAKTDIVEQKTIGTDNNYIDAVENGLSAIEVMSDEGKGIADALKIKEGLEKVSTYLKRAERDIHNIENSRKSLTPDEIRVKKKEINDETEKQVSSAIKSFEILDTEEFVKYPSYGDIEELADDYLKYSNFTFKPKAKTAYMKAINDIQLKTVITTIMRKINLEYVSGEKEIVTFVEMKIKYDGNLTGKLYILEMPEEIAKSNDEINMLAESKLLNANKFLYGFDASKIKDIMFYFHGEKEQREVKDMKIVLVANADNIKNEKGGINLIGYAIFSKLESIDNPAMVIQVVIIIVLLLVFFAYQFDIINLIGKKLSRKEKELAEIYGIVKDVNNALKDNEIDNARILYSDIMKAYKKLSDKSRAKILPETKDIYHKIVEAEMNEIMELAHKHIDKKEHDKAREIYSRMTDLYRQLPQEYKKKLSEKCKSLFDKISN